MSSPIAATPPAIVAEQAVLLSSRTGAEPGLWPVFALVLGDRSVPGDLIDLLDEPDRLVVLDGEANWTVLDPARPLLRLALRATGPVPLNLDIVVPAQPVVGLLKELANGVTVGITTRRHAGALLDDGPRPMSRQLLHRMGLVNARPAAELDTLAADRTVI